MFVGVDYTSDARPNLLNLELCKECSRTLGMAWNLPEKLAGSSGRNWGAAVKADAIGYVLHTSSRRSPAKVVERTD